MTWPDAFLPLIPVVMIAVVSTVLVVAACTMIAFKREMAGVLSVLWRRAAKPVWDDVIWSYKR